VTLKLGIGVTQGHRIECGTIRSDDPENLTLEANITSIGKTVAKLWPWPSAAILDFIEPQIAPFDPPTPKTLNYNQTWSGSVAPFARYAHLNYTVTLKLGFGVTQGHRKWHYSIEHITG